MHEIERYIKETNSIASFETAKEIQECYCTKCPDLTDGSHCCSSLLKDFDKGGTITAIIYMDAFLFQS